MSTENSLHFIKKYFPFLFIVIPAIFLFNAELCLSQTRAEGITPKMTEPGSPAGSYSLSGFESINLFNGNLNFSLPLVNIGGRGKAKSMMNLSIDSARWNVEKDGLTFGEPATGLNPLAARTVARLNGNTYSFNAMSQNEYCITITEPSCGPVELPSNVCIQVATTHCESSSLNDAPTSGDIINNFSATMAGLMVPNGFFYHYYTVREDLQDAIVGYGPGMMVARGGKIEPLLSRQPSGYKIRSLTRLFFLSPDGTEHELRDILTGGKDKFHWNYEPINRGTVFEASDGSGLRFVSTAPIIDFWVSDNTDLPPTSFPSGVLYFPDGTKYGVTNGNVVWIKDVDGNKVTFTYNAQKQVTGAIDSLGRQIVVNYALPTNDPEVKFDEIKTQTSDSTWQTIKIYRTTLDNVLRDGYQLLTEAQMFPAMQQAPTQNPPPYNPNNVVQKVELPDGRSYNLYYTPYKEIARVVLPTGAAIEYDFPVPSESSPAETVFRPVKERRVYKDGGSIVSNDNYDSRQVYLRENFVSNFSSFSGKVGVQECAGKTNELQCDVNTRTDHYFYGAANTLNHSFYPKWNEGKEHKTDLFTTNGTTDTLKSRTETEWEYPAEDPAGTAPKKVRVKSVTSTVFDSGRSLTSKVQYGYDDNSTTNNKTDEWVFNYGVGAPGRLIKHSKTTYLGINEHHSNIDYTDPSVYLLGLPRSTELYDISYTGAETLIAKSEVLYDEVTADRAPLSYGLTTLTGWENPDPDDKPFELRNIRGAATTSRVWRNTDNSWIETHAQFDQLGNPRKAWDANSNLSQILYDPQYLYAFPTSAITPVPDPTGQHGSNTSFVTASEYDFYTAQVKKVTDANGRHTLTEYNDILQRPTKVTAPNGQQTIFEYGDTAGDLYVKVRKQIDEINWDETTTYFDGLGRGTRKKSKDSQGDVSVNTGYDELGRVEKVSNPYRAGEDMLWTHTTYDELGRIIKVKTPDNAEVTSAYSLATGGVSIGSAVTVTDQALKLRRSITNVLGQLVQVDEPGSANTLDPLPSATPAPTPGPGPTPNPTPDPTPTPDPGGPGNCGGPGQPTCAPELAASYPMASTYYQYDGAGNLKKVIQGEQTRTFTYNSLGQLLSAINPESGTITYAYDNVGNLTSKTDARGISASYGYDVFGRVISRTYSDPTPAVNYFYDNLPNAKGELLKVSSSVSMTEYTAFDNMGRLLAHRQTTNGQAFDTSYKYNLSGALIEEVYPSGEIVRNFLQSDGDLDRVAVSGRTYASDPHFAASGALTSLRLGNGNWESSQFNSRLQPTRIALGKTKDATDLMKLDYNYGSTQNNGNVLSQTITVPEAGQTPGFIAVQSYTYDSLNRLKNAQETVGATQSWKQAFLYDRYGNRNLDEENTTTLQKGCLENLVPAVCVNDRKALNPEINRASNRFKSGQNYAYDQSGNVTGDALERTFVYNGENKQIEVWENSALLGRYYYDGDGKRIRKEVPNGETTVFVYDAAGKLIAEYSSQLSQQPQLAYLTNDSLGTPRINTDAHGAVVSRHDYHPFGEEIHTPDRIQNSGYINDDVRKQFTGYERDDETGLDFAQARYFGSSHGRFASPDPVMISQLRKKNPQIWNAYSYVGNNPLKYTDPLGLEKIKLGESVKQIEKSIEAKKTEKKGLEAEKNQLRKNKASKEEIEKKQAEIDLTNAALGTLDKQLEGTIVVMTLLKALDKVGELKGALLSDFTLSTDAQEDFKGVSPASMNKILKSQAFESGGEIFIRTDKDEGFYKAITTQEDFYIKSDFSYMGASVIAHELYHKRFPRVGENGAYSREREVFVKFENYFNFKSIYKSNLAEIDANIAANP